MSSQINNLVRTQNYRRLAAQLESKTARVTELERQLSEAKQTSTSATEKADAYDVLADSLGLVNKVHELNAFSDPIDQEPAPDDAFFDNKMHQKVLQVKSIELTPVNGEENKFAVSAELASEEKIFNNSGKQLCTFKSLKLGVVTIEGGEYKYGDLKEVPSFTSEYETLYGDSYNGTPEGAHAYTEEHPIGLSIVDKALLKVPAEGTPSLGDLDVKEIEAFVDTTSLFHEQNNDSWRWYVRLQLPLRDEEHQGDENDLTLKPFPGEKPEDGN